MLGDHRNQIFHLPIADRRIHTSKFQTLPATDAGVSDDGNPPIEKTLPQRRIQAVGIDSCPRRQIAKDDGAQTVSMNKL